MILDNPPMGTLYAVGAPADVPDDLTQRALRVLSESALIAADIDAAGSGGQAARHLLEYHNIPTPLFVAGELPPVLHALESADVALLLTGWSPVPMAFGQQLVQAAIEAGFPVVPIPGPGLPIAALVVSGLPADGFVYLGSMPPDPSASRELLARRVRERRTLVALASVARLSDTFVLLNETLGDRLAVLVAAAGGEMEVVWQGTLASAPGQLPTLSQDATLVLVIAGAPVLFVKWEEDQLQAEIAARLEQGLGAKEIGRTLARESGWPRRNIYRRAVEQGGSRPKHPD